MSESEKKEKRLNIVVDDTAMKEMAQEIAQKKVENEFLTKGLEGAEEAQKFFDETKQRLAQDYAKLGLTLPDVQTKADLDSAIQNLVQLRQEKAGSPSGTPNTLNERQYGIQDETDLKKKKFDSHEQMIEFLREQEKAGDPEAKAVLNELWKRTVLALQKGETISYGSNGDNPKADEGKAPVEIQLTGSERNDPNSELQRYLNKANERAREQARQKSANYYSEVEAERQKQAERQKRVK
jgi:hypothetical protein